MTNSQDPSSQAPSTNKSSAPQKPLLPPPSRKKKIRSGPAKPAIIWPLYLLLFFVVSLTGTAGVYFWQNLTQQKLEISQLSSGKKYNSEQISQLSRNVSQQLHELDNNSKSNNQQLIKLDKQSLYITQKLIELGASSRSDWLMAEAEYLLHLANQRLNLEHDPKGSEAILITADSVLAENDDPGLLPVRQALATEILSLQQVSVLDRNGIFLRLAAIITALDELDESAFLGRDSTQSKQDTPPSNALSTRPENKNNLQALWQQIWSDLQQVFVIRRLDHTVEPLLAPKQSYYLKQNLRLMLEQANLALLDDNALIFQSSLRKASSWLENYFDIKDDRINALLSNINALKTLDITQKTPDISNSLRLLKTKIEAMYRNHRLGKLSTPDAEHQERLIKTLEKQLQEQSK